MNLHEMDLRHLIHNEVRFRDLARKGTTIITRAEGSTIYDTEGRAYLDAQAGMVLVNIGYGRKELGAVAAAQMGRLMYYHTYFQYANEPAVRLAAKLASLAPAGLGKVFFTLGGAESVETAVKIARLYQRARGRAEGHKIICLDLGYHGNSLGALSATAFAAHRAYYDPLVPGFVHIPSPDTFEGPYRADDPGAGARYAALLEERILAEGPETVAAFLAEPILGVGGIIIPPDDYHRHVRQICDRYGVLLILDEVMTGFGRTGTLWACEQFGVVPDLLCTAKGLTSGYLPLGAVLVGDHVIEAIAEADLPFEHGFTYAGHPVSCAVAMKNIEIIEQERLAERAARMGERLRAGLVARDNPYIAEVRGRGLMVAAELVRDRETRERFPAGDQPFRFAVEAGALREGVITGIAPYRDTLMITPPLVITEEEVDRLVDVYDRVIRQEGDRRRG